MSRKLKSGVYFVANKDQESFYRDAELSGWTPFYKSSSGNPDTITPMSLDKNSTRIGYWTRWQCHSQEEAQKFIDN